VESALRLDHAKRDRRRRRRLENENIDEKKYVVVRKIEKVIVIVSGDLVKISTDTMHRAVPRL